jgi:hypothetical protein
MLLLKAPADSMAGFVALLALAGSVSIGATPSKTANAWPIKPRETVSAQAREEVLEGDLEVLIEDSGRGSRTVYFLTRGDERIALRFATSPRNLTTGTRVRVRGSYEAGGSFLVVSFERVAPAS